jgi:DNA repair exonuclease SbcCD ATPase subunit
MTIADTPIAEAARTNGFIFPRLLEIELRAFSLYRRVTDAKIVISDGVSCFVGANGIGKSTFIAAVNYGLTGRVAKPGHTFTSAEEYYKETQAFAREYFAGRIDEEDRPAAEIRIEFAIAGVTFSIRRGFFELSELRSLRITEDHRIVFEGDSGSTSGSELQKVYERELCSRMGVEEFYQFAFLQQFVLTFDEQRHLAFWDSKTLQQMLFLAFGVDAATAVRAETFSRTVEKQDSLRRNYQWQATEARKKIKDLDNVTTDSDGNDDEIVEQHQNLIANEQEVARLLESREAELADHRLQVADATSRYITLQDEYDRLFHVRSKQTDPLRHHPVVVTTINENRCVVCGNTDIERIEGVKVAVASRQCPLCRTQHPAGTKRDPKVLEALQRVDQELATTRSQISNETLAVRRVEDELREVAERHARIAEELAEFERDNAIAARVVPSDADALRAMYTNQIDRFLQQKEAARERRDKARDELTKLQNAVRKQYEHVEEDFVPLFRELAFSFLGLNLDIRFNVRGAQISLALIVESKERIEPHQLSESQRFFVDIALRMALARFMVGEPGASMLIDTPEGSLDAAYESRAGEMFAKFARAGNQILMTANVNTSRLLLRLAERCGHAFMQLIRMTEWAYLSEVQTAEENQFDAAYAAVEACLVDGDAQNESSSHI